MSCLCSSNDPIVPSNMVVGNVTGSQRSTRSMNGLGNHPLQQAHTSPPVVSPLTAELGSIPEAILVDQPSHQQPQHEEQQLDAPIILYMYKSKMIKAYLLKLYHPMACQLYRLIFAHLESLIMCQ